VDVEDEEAAIRRDVLLYEMTEERTLYHRPGFAKDRHVHRATRVTERLVPLRSVTIRDPESKVECATFLPCSASPALEAVPESNKKLFEELFHSVMQCA